MSENSEAKAKSDMIPPFDEAGLMEWIRPVQDPELYLSLVDLGLVYAIDVFEGGKAQIRMTLTSPGCPAGDYIIDQLTGRLKEHPEVKEASVEIVWEPKWDPHEMATEECKEELGIW